MAEPLTFTRLYPDRDGLEHAATPERVRRVIASMNASVDSDWPFKVRLRLDDGSVVVVKPRRGH